jgi:RNA polymerase sigma factor (sigma-70 family)
MAHSVNYVLAQMQRWTAAQTADLSDAELLERYVHQGDDNAFAALVARYGAMVLRVCRRILGANPDAEDAFQAAFLILARKASSLRRAEALPGWLHCVARRAALKARAQVKGRFSSDSLLDDTLTDPHPDPLTRLTARELLDVVDEEVQHLPSPQRSAVVLCCLEGQTREEAARQLGWTLAALKSHLQRGRQRLQARLNRRGIALPAALAVVAVSRGEAASALLLRSTATAALGGGVGTSAAALAHSVLKTMLLTKLVAVMSVVMMIGVAASATFAVIYRGSAVEDSQDTPAVTAALREPVPGKPQPRTDALGDPLPDGAIARLGTVRFRHGEKITFVAFTADGKRLVSRGDDGVRTWDVATGKQLRHFVSPPGKNWGATDLSPDGKTLAAASRGGSIDFLDISSDKKLISLGRGKYTSVRLSPNGKLLAAFSQVNKDAPMVELWDVRGQRKLRDWKPQGRQPLGMNFIFSADSRKLLTSGLFGKVILWDTENGRQLHEFKRLDQQWIFSSLGDALSPDGKLVALFESAEMVESKAGAVEWKARISLHDAMTGKRVRLLTCPSRVVYPQGIGADFSALTFTPDGKKLVTGGPDRFLRIWDAATGDELQRWPLELGQPELLTLSGDGQTLAAVMVQSKAIQLLDMAGGKPRHSFAGHLSNICLSALTPDCRSAVTSDGGGKMFVWDAAAGRIRRVLQGHEGRPIFSLQLAADGRTLYSVGWDKNVRVWDLSTGEERRRFSLGQVTPFESDSLALSPDGKILAVLSSEKSFRLLDTTSGRELHRFGGQKQIMGAAFTADSRSLVVWSGGPKVCISDVRTGRLLRDYPLPKELVMDGAAGFLYSAAVSSDGRLLAFGTYRYRPRHFLVLKDLATGRDVHRLDNLPGAVVGLASSPDGRVLAWSGAKDCSIHLVETASGGERRRLPGHPGAEVVYPLAFSVDGTRLISGGGDTTVLIWDVRDPAEQHRATAAELQVLWTDLAAKDAAPAYRAIRKLAASPTSAIPFLRKLVRPAPALDEKRLARLIADLDSDDFTVRQKAAAELEKLDERALPVYRNALQSKPSLETRRRLQDLMEKVGPAWWDVSGERLRSLRAVEVLELAGTQQARELLKNLAAGAEGARLTEEAKASLQRLGQQAQK